MAHVRNVAFYTPAAGVLDARRVITYGGAWIAASTDAFALMLLGRENVAVYDASLSE